MKAGAPSKNTALICLLLFVLGLAGHFIPFDHIAYIGPILQIFNHIAVDLLIGGYGLLLLGVYIL